MRFVLAVLDAFDQYVTFSGRTRRGAYWCYALFAGVLFALAWRLDSGTVTVFFEGVVLLGLGLPTVAATARRLHDTGNSGLWLFVVLIPLAGVVALIVLTCLPGQPGTNRFGPAPLPASNPRRQYL